MTRVTQRQQKRALLGKMSRRATARQTGLSRGEIYAALDLVHGSPGTFRALGLLRDVEVKGPMMKMWKRRNSIRAARKAKEAQK